MNDYDNVRKETQAHLDRSLDELDSEITDRLAASREKALREAALERPRRSRTPMAIAGVAASVAMVAVLATFTGETGSPQPGAEDIELMAAEEPLEFYQDLDFYLWLEQQEIDELSGAEATST